MNIEDRQVFHVPALWGSRSHCLLHGYEVIVYNVSSESLEIAAANIRAYAEQLVGQKRLSLDKSKAVLASITPSRQRLSNLGEQEDDGGSRLSMGFWSVSMRCKPCSPFGSPCSDKERGDEVWSLD